MKDAAVRRRSCPRKSGTVNVAAASACCRFPRAPSSTYAARSRRSAASVGAAPDDRQRRRVERHAMRQLVLAATSPESSTSRPRGRRPASASRPLPRPAAPSGAAACRTRPSAGSSASNDAQSVRSSSSVEHPVARLLRARPRNPDRRDSPGHEIAVEREREHLRQQRRDAVRHDRRAGLGDASTSARTSARVMSTIARCRHFGRILCGAGCRRPSSCASAASPTSRCRARRGRRSSRPCGRPASRSPDRRPCSPRGARRARARAPSPARSRAASPSVSRRSRARWRYRTRPALRAGSASRAARGRARSRRRTRCGCRVGLMLSTNRASTFWSASAAVLSRRRASGHPKLLGSHRGHSRDESR